MTSPKPLSILFVDYEADVEPMVRLKLRRQIRNGTYDIAFTTDGRDALKRLALAPRPIVVTEYLSFMKPLRKLDPTVIFRAAQGEAIGTDHIPMIRLYTRARCSGAAKLVPKPERALQMSLAPLREECGPAKLAGSQPLPRAAP